MLKFTYKFDALKKNKIGYSGFTQQLHGLQEAISIRPPISVGSWLREVEHCRTLKGLLAEVFQGCHGGDRYSAVSCSGSLRIRGFHEDVYGAVVGRVSGNSVGVIVFCFPYGADEKLPSRS